MNRSPFAIVCALLIVVGWTASPSSAQQKTVKECQDEWRANKADNQAKGIKEKDYVAQCRGTAATAAPAAAPVQTNVAPPPLAPSGKGKSAKECRAEWRVNKADNEAKGITEKQYIAQCRGGAIAVAPTPAPAPAPAPAPTTARSAPTTTVNTRPPVAPTAPTGVGQYQTEAEAKGRCFSDTVVWVNLKSRIYHFAGTKKRKHQRRHLHVRERGNSSRRSSVKDGKASLGKPLTAGPGSRRSGCADSARYGGQA